MANYQIKMADGERWLCKYDPDLDMYYWEPLPPEENPGDGVVWKRVPYTAPDGISHVQMPRLEWIDYKLYSGTDTFLRRPLTEPLFAANPNSVGVYSRVLVYDAASQTWSTCRESGWVNNSTAGSDTLAPTFAWGNAPCESPGTPRLGGLGTGAAPAPG